MSFAEKLAQLRGETKESLQDVATVVGSSKAHIWELETGKSQNPSIELVRRLADHFKVSVAWLVGEATFQGKGKEHATALYRSLNDLSQPNRQILQTIIDGMKKASKSE